MASGIFKLTRKLNANEIAFDGRIVWSSESNGTKKNSSKVTAELQLMKPNKATTTGTWTGSFTVGAKTVDVSKYQAVGADWVTIETITTTVSHKADGAGTCYLHAKIDGPSATSVRGTSVSGSETVQLDKIARFATIISGEDFTDEGNPTIKYYNPAGSAVSSLKACISLDGTKADVPYRDIPVDGNTYTFNLTDAERNTLRNATPNSNTMQVMFVVRSVIGDQHDTDNVKATMRIVNANPIASITIADTNSETINLTGNSKHLIALHSVAKVRMSATPQKSATLPVDGIKVINGKSVLISGGSAEPFFSPITLDDITYEVTDSRGNTAKGFVDDVIVLPYINPTVAVKNSMPDGNGNMTLVATGKAYAGPFGSTENSITIRYRYRTSSGTHPAWRTFSNVTWVGNNFTATEQITGLDYTKRYIFQAAVEDSLHAYPGVISKSQTIKARPVFDWGENDFKFNVPVYDQTGELIGNTAEEWQNPPLVSATQYGTRERHLGKRVYVKLVDLGSLPNTSTKAVSYNTMQDVRAFSFEVFARASSDDIIQSFPLARTSDGTITARANVTDYSVEVKTFSDLSHYTGFAKIKYTKG